MKTRAEAGEDEVDRDALGRGDLQPVLIVVHGPMTVSNR